MTLTFSRTRCLRWGAPLAIAALIAAGCGNSDESVAPQATEQVSPTPSVEPDNDPQPTPSVEPDNSQPTTPEAEPPSVDSQSTAGNTGSTPESGDVPSPQDAESGDVPSPQDAESGDVPSPQDAEPVPEPEDEIDFEELSEPPRRADSASTADYITEFMVWLASADVGRETGECYAKAFLEIIEEDRLEMVAATAETIQLYGKLPNNLLTEAEMSLFIDNTQHCAQMGIRKALDVGWLMEEVDIDPETFTLPPNFTQLASECVEMMVADTTTLEMSTRAALFEEANADASNYLAEKLADTCDEEILDPLIAISFAATSSLDYEAALCMLNIDLEASSKIDEILEEMFAMMEDMMDGMSEEDINPDDAVWDSAMSELNDALSECGVSPDVFDNLLEPPSENQSTPGSQPDE